MAVHGACEFEFEALTRAVHYRAALLREFRSCLVGRVLEVGAGIGQMTEVLRAVPSVLEVVALEPSSYLAERFRDRLPAAKLLRGTSEDLPRGDVYDAVVLINVLEHIEDDLEELARLRKHLSPGGKLCLFVPARPELYSKLDRQFGHYRRYTRRQLTEVLRAAGYQPIDVHYFNVLGYLAWYLMFTLRGATHFNPTGVSIYDKYVFRPTICCERLFGNAPIGQSLVAISTPA